MFWFPSCCVCQVDNGRHDDDDGDGDGDQVGVLENEKLIFFALGDSGEQILTRSRRNSDVSIVNVMEAVQ